MNIFDNYQSFLLNFFVIFSFFFVYFNFIEGKMNRLTNEFFITILSGISIILCMTFPIHTTGGYIFDLRQVPFIIGALYGGRRVIVLLLLTVIVYRFYLGESPGGYTAAGASLFLSILLWYLIPLFNKVVRTKKRIFLATLISFFGILIRTLIISLFFYELLETGYHIFLIFFLLIQSLCIILFVGFIEKSRRDTSLAKEVNKLEKLRTVSDIAASISHEVRNPLTVTKGFLQLLREPGLTDQDKNDYIKTALDALDQAESTITDYLTFAKPSLEHIKILDLKKELAYIIKVVEPFAALNDVRIELCQHANVYIAGEDQKLHQCLINLTKNAIEAMPEGGKLIISLQELSSKAVITVTDTGVGMTNEQIERLGTPYYTTKEKGTGLGTMVVFSIVKAMRGEIKVKSEIGKGTLFTILLPAVEHSPSFTEEIVS
jgi:two-component system sporulation sensor kinase B